MERIVNLYLAVFACAAAYVSSSSLNPSDYSSDQIIRTDVAVIGGGSSGTYTAVGLKDRGYNVVVIEEKPQLGGHAQTYVDPINGYTIDIGVIVFDNNALVKDYFNKFNVPLIPLPTGSAPPQYVNPSTGQILKNFKGTSEAAFGAALEAYSAQLAKYPSIQLGFDLVYPVASDLLEPFGTFLAKYNIQNLFPSVYFYNQGYVPILEIPTLYMLKYLNPGEVQSFESGYLTTKNHDLFALYAAAAKYLGKNNVLFSSTVQAMKRTKNSVTMCVNTPTGPKLVISKRLVSAIPPTLQNLHGYDLSSQETRLFSQFFANGYVTSVLNHTGLTLGMDYNSVDPSQPLDIPVMPNAYGFSVNEGTNLTQIYYASPHPQSDADAKAGILSALERFQKANGIKETGGEFLDFSNHAPFNIMVSTDAIKGGFYKRLDALNGQQSTFWNGAAFQTQDSSALWNYTESVVLPRVLASLK